MATPSEEGESYVSFEVQLNLLLFGETICGQSVDGRSQYPMFVLSDSDLLKMRLFGESNGFAFFEDKCLVG